MVSAVFDHVIEHAFTDTGDINWTTAQVLQWVGLGATGFAAAVNKNTWSHYSDITNQVASGNGYTTGGEQLVVGTAAAGATNVCKFPATDTAWTASTFDAYDAFTHSGATRTTSTGVLITYHGLGGVQSVVAGTLTLEWHADGVWKVTISDAA